MNQQEITTSLALWGAVTGTIGTVSGLLGLWLRFRQHGLDKAKLKCDSSFGYDSPTHNKHKITIRAIGRRPVTIDSIRYFITPHNKWQKLIKHRLHQQGKWCWDQDQKKCKIGEGEKVEINISLPDGIDITKIYKVAVVDQTGRQWSVRWPSLGRLSKAATMEQIDLIEDKAERRAISVTGFRLGEKYYLQTTFDSEPNLFGIPSGRNFWFSNKSSYKEKFNEVVEIQMPKYLAGEENQIL